MIIKIVDYLKERPGPVKFSFYVAIAIMVVWSIGGVDNHHAHTWAEMYIPGFWSFFGLAACIVLIYVARWLGKSGIMTREDYYDN